jgi:hypothetical protein
MGQHARSLTIHELVVFLTAVTFLAMEQRVNTKFYFKLSKAPTETYEMLPLSGVMKS